MKQNESSDTAGRISGNIKSTREVQPRLLIPGRTCRGIEVLRTRRTIRVPSESSQHAPSEVRGSE